MPVECCGRLFLMRGDDRQLQPGMFSYVSLEDRIADDHPLRAIRKLVDQVLAGMSQEFDGVVLRGGSAIDPAGAAPTCPITTGVLLDPQRTIADGTTRLQPAVPLVCGLGDRRQGVGCDGVRQE